MDGGRSLFVFGIFCFLLGIGVYASGNVGVPPGFSIAFFGHQDEENRYSSAHTFAVVYNAIPDEAELDGLRVETHTISWLPVSMRIEATHLIPEPGINQESLEWNFENARRLEVPVYAWGPYAIKQELYERFLDRINDLDGGLYKYAVVDVNVFGQRKPYVFNCIHAISDLFAPLKTKYQRGFGATASVVRHLSPHFLKKEANDSYLLERLGIRTNLGQKYTKFSTHYMVTQNVL